MGIQGREEWAKLCVGIWNGSRTTSDGNLLYRRLLSDALVHGLSGGTVWRVIEGGNRNGIFRSIESEVASNELPVWIEFIDAPSRVLSWLPVVQPLLAKSAVLVLHHQVHTGVGLLTHLRAADGADSRGGITNMKPGDGTNTGTNHLGNHHAHDHGNHHMHPPTPAIPSMDGLQVTIYTLEKTKVGGKLLYQAVAEYLRHKDILWVATMRGLYGYGEARAMRQSGWFSKENTPVMMVAADRAEKFAPLVPGLVELIGDKGFLVTSLVTWMEP